MVLECDKVMDSWLSKMEYPIHVIKVNWDIVT
jgi:hypothetical protein